jgi:dTDP-4-amino-4,6-dideoxygalactose transaminase
MRSLQSIAQRRSLVMIEDCCQAHLATCDDVPVGTRGAGGAFSFYPTKNLAALGDGGAILTKDASLAERLRRLRNGGQIDRYVHLEAGDNSRLDDLQAAVLRARLPLLSGWTSRRRSLAAAYRRALPDNVRPLREHDAGHVYHLFVVRSPNRDALHAHLRASGVDTLIHYPVPLHSQPAFAGIARGDCPVASRMAREILSLPLHPRLTDADVARVSAAIGAFQKGRILA